MQLTLEARTNILPKVGGMLASDSSGLDMVEERGLMASHPPPCTPARLCHTSPQHPQKLCNTPAVGLLHLVAARSLCAADIPAGCSKQEGCESKAVLPLTSRCAGGDGELAVASWDMHVDSANMPQSVHGSPVPGGRQESFAHWILTGEMPQRWAKVFPAAPRA